MTKFFISYRRVDSEYPAHQLCDAIRTKYQKPGDEVFIDVDNIPAGVPFEEYLSKRVQQCDVLFALIGNSWLEAKDEYGLERLKNPDDFVRIEIASALEQGKRVVPILLDGAEIPKAKDLPPDMQELSRRNGIKMQRESFPLDCDRLIEKLDLDEPGSTKPGTPLMKGVALLVSALIVATVFAYPFVSKQWPELMKVVFDETPPVVVVEPIEPPPPPPPDLRGADALVPVEKDLSDAEIKTRVEECDKLAAHHRDKSIPDDIPGRSFEELKAGAKKAIRACRDALAAAPSDDTTFARMHLNYARSLIADDKPTGVIKFYERAEEFGSYRAKLTLGMLYTSGEYGPQNFAKAKEYFETANNLQEPTAAVALARFAEFGIGESRNAQKAVIKDGEGVERGDNRALYNMGVHILSLRPDSWPNLNEAFLNFRKSVQGKHKGKTPLAHTQLGWMYENGHGPDKDLLLAEAEYIEAANQNHQLANLALARLYASGELGEVDMRAAEARLNRAIDLNGRGLLQDAFWLYTPNPQFDKLTSKAWFDLLAISRTDEGTKLGILVDTLEQQIKDGYIPGRAEYTCDDGSKYAEIEICHRYIGERHIGNSKNIFDQSFRPPRR